MTAQSPSRRRFLAGAGASVALPSAIAGQALAATKSLKARVYPIHQPLVSGPYPEQSIPRYSAAAGKWGVAFSGGGARSFSASVGQMRGLLASGVVDDIGAISCVSGATWFGGTYTFAPGNFSDATLLGPLVAPANITVKKLNEVDEFFLGTRITELKDLNLFTIALYEILNYENGLIPIDKLYSRLLNDAFLAPYGLDSTNTLFTLNEASLAAIRARNPGLKTPFMLPRPGRPFLIAGATQIFQQGKPKQTPVRKIGIPGQVYHPIEYTPLYTGGPFLQKQGSGFPPFGGGYVESFAFDTPAPTSVSNDVATVQPGAYPFLLSDVLGSSSASIGAYAAEYFKPTPQYDPFPAFDYWPVSDIGKEPATEYNIADGGVLEDSGVVALLRRGYKTIFAFVNSEHPIRYLETQPKEPSSVDGIDGEISRLFGHIPMNNSGNAQSTQVFDRAQFVDVAHALKEKMRNGQAPVYAAEFPVLADNPFGIAPYTPKIFWIYNDTNQAWFNKLRPSVQALFSNPKYNLADFPNYATVAQNKPELLYLSPTQVNLLAHMWAYTVTEGFKDFGYAFGYPIS